MNTIGLLCFVVLCIAVIPAQAKFEEHKLLRSLLAEYEAVGGKLARPVESVSDTLTLRMGLALIKINFDEKTRLLTSRAWLRYMWNDALLTWDPSKFGSIDHTRISTEHTWMPDFTLYNSVGSVYKDFDAMAVASYDGTILYIPPVTMVTECDQLNGYYQCHFKFGSWTFDGFKLDIEMYNDLSDIDVNDYRKSPEWEIMNTSAQKNTMYYPCCEEPYPDITFQLEIRKREPMDE